jgi:hypothetical protein
MSAVLFDPGLSAYRKGFLHRPAYFSESLILPAVSFG